MLNDEINSSRNHPCKFKAIIHPVKESAYVVICYKVFLKNAGQMFLRSLVAEH